VVDVLDRVLDKGIVIDAWVRVSLVGIDLLTVEVRVVVASIATYLQFSQDIAQLAAASRPGAGLASAARNEPGHHVSRPVSGAAAGAATSGTEAEAVGT
jgi:hypothetical protein